MKSTTWALIVLAVLVAAIFAAGKASAQGLEKAPRREYVKPDQHQGWIPHPWDRSHLRPARLYRTAFLAPPSWDWRALGGVTSVKNQNPYGTCWAFGTLGSFESVLLINEGGPEPDFSEHNVAACANNGFYEEYGYSCNTGGNDVIAVNYLIQLGSVDESCDSYPGSCPSISCVNPACAFGKQVTEWIAIPEDDEAIKEALMNYGPVITSMYSSFSAFQTYDGSGCLTYSTTNPQDHCVLIVGWDDAICGGNGGWIVKNSWGTGWGDDGYFYIEYGSARIGEDNSVITGWKDPDPSETFLYYDEYGLWRPVGWADYDDWGMVELTPTTNEFLLAVDFWAVSAPTIYTLYVYDTFSGGTLSDLLMSQPPETLDYGGYYSIVMNPPIPVTAGDPIYIAIRFNTPGFDHPIPMDEKGPMETNKSYVRNSDAYDWEALDMGYYEMGDAGIRARIGSKLEEGGCSMEGDPGFYYGFPSSIVDIFAGQTLCYEMAPTNFGFASVTCTDADTFCVTATSANGWAITGPDLGQCLELESGYYIPVDVCVTAPCEANIGDYDTVLAYNAFCDTNGVCAPECGDCEDPNWHDGDPYYWIDTLILHVVKAPPALYILQDSLSEVSFGQTAAYVQFLICNGDPCAPPADFGYRITNKGYVSGPTVDDTVTVNGGECEDVYMIVDAGSAPLYKYDTLAIVAWSVDMPVEYDTCVQIIWVLPALPVPLFTAPVVMILALAMVLTAAVFMRMRAAGRA